MKTEEKTKVTIKRGIYETIYGNAAYVAGTGAKTAYDLDMGERIPIGMVNLNRLIRRAKSRHE